MSASLLGLLCCLSAVPAQAAQLDSSFGESGIVFTTRLPGAPSISAAEEITLTRRGQIVALGNDSDGLMVLARYLNSGALDRSFGVGGLSYTARFQRKLPLGFGRDLAVADQGGIFTTGTLGYVQNIDPLSRFQGSFGAKLNPNGSLAKGYADGGNRELRLGGLNPNAGLRSQALSLGPWNSLYIAGQAIHGIHRTAGFIARLTPTGQLDKSFKGSRRTRTSTKGVVEFRPPWPGHATVTDIRSLTKGGVLFGGTMSGAFAAGRLKRGGSFDLSFGKSGFRTIDVDGDPGCGCSYVRALARDRWGRIILAGYTIDRTTTEENARLAIVRLNPNGSLDESFGSRGVARPPLPDFYESNNGLQLQRFLTTGVAVQRDGRIVISGEYNRRFAAVRLKRNGDLDPSFFGEGIFTDWVQGSYGAAWDVLVDRMNRIVVSGGTENGDFVLMRFLNN